MPSNRAPIPKPIEKLVYQQARSRCSFCHYDEIAALDIHHIVPRSKGGSNEPANLVLVCKNCHARIHGRAIAEPEVRRIKASQGAVIHRVPGASTSPPSGQVVSVGRDANGSIIAGGDVHVYGDAKLKGKMNHPAGSIGADLLRKNYIQHLIGRYDDFKRAGHQSYGQQGQHSYGAIHRNIQGKFKAKTYFIPVERFDELVRYLKSRIDQTIQGKRNRASGGRAYPSFDEFALVQSGC